MFIGSCLWIPICRGVRYRITRHIFSSAFSISWLQLSIHRDQYPRRAWGSAGHGGAGGNGGLWPLLQALLDIRSGLLFRWIAARLKRRASLERTSAGD